MSEKDRLLIKIDRKEKQRRKQMIHENFVGCLRMTCVWKKMGALDTEQSANNSLLCSKGSLGSTSASKRDLKSRYIQGKWTEHRSCYSKFCLSTSGYGR